MYGQLNSHYASLNGQMPALSKATHGRSLTLRKSKLAQGFRIALLMGWSGGRVRGGKCSLLVVPIIKLTHYLPNMYKSAIKLQVHFLVVSVILLKIVCN